MSTACHHRLPLCGMEAKRDTLNRTSGFFDVWKSKKQNILFLLVLGGGKVRHP